MKLQQILAESQSLAEKKVGDTIEEWYKLLNEKGSDSESDSEIKQCKKSVKLNFGKLFRALFQTTMKNQTFDAWMWEYENNKGTLKINFSLDTYNCGDRSVEDIKKDTDALMKRILGTDAESTFESFGKEGESPTWTRWSFYTTLNMMKKD
jgi:hypothetical protein